MGQAKLRGTLEDRKNSAGEKGPKPTKQEARRLELLARREVPEGRIGVAVLEKGILLAVHHFPVVDFVGGRAIVADGAVDKMKGILGGDPKIEPRAMHFLRHAGLDRLRGRYQAGFGFLLWSVVNDHQVGPQVTQDLTALVEANGGGALMVVATDGLMHMIVGKEFPADLENPDLGAVDGFSIHTVPLTYNDLK